MRLIYVINGPNLNMLGKREVAIYGQTSLDAIQSRCAELVEKSGFAMKFLQSNFEGEIVSYIQESYEQDADGVVINPAGYSHSSIAILDALLMLKCPIVEVHLSNIHQRESFRRHSYCSQAAQAVLSGFGPLGYEYALKYLITKITKNPIL